jgi:hypothetical protein
VLVVEIEERFPATAGQAPLRKATTSPPTGVNRSEVGEKASPYSGRNDSGLLVVRFRGVFCICCKIKFGLIYG